MISATSLSAVAFADPPNAQFENKYVFVTGSMIGTATVSALRVIKHREIYQSGRYTTEGVMKVEDPSLQVCFEQEREKPRCA